MSVILLPATTGEELEQARTLFREYAAETQLDLAFQNFESELAGLPGRYAPPSGRLFLARAGANLAGCGALRSMENDVCEMKRLFVRPACRHLGIGRVLAEQLLREARAIGYAVMRLDTLDTMLAALALYESLGFHRIEPYYANPLPGVVYLERPI